MKKLSILFSAILCFGLCSSAQDITVHAIDFNSGKPVKGIDIDFRDDCLSRNPPKGFSQKTNNTGITVFRNYKISDKPFCLSVFSIEYASRTLDYIFISPGLMSPKSLNPVISSLPSDITFKVQKRSFAQQMHFIFVGD